MNLIYQYWIGEMTNGARESQRQIKEYAKQIGAHYRFDTDGPKVLTSGNRAPYYDIFRPLYEGSFKEYDHVLYLDTDIYRTTVPARNIFEEAKGNIMMAEEKLQPALRAKKTKGICGAKDEEWGKICEKKWGCILPRDRKGRLRVFNSGVVMFSRAFMEDPKMIPVRDYLSHIPSKKFHGLYRTDQNYLHACSFRDGVDFQELHPDWNAFMHGVRGSDELVNTKTETTQLVHIQCSGADHWSAKKLDHYAKNV